MLYAVDVSGNVKEKNGLSYLSWASAWAEVKKLFPDATYRIYESTNPSGFVTNYFTDGKTCWVKTGVTVCGIEHIEELPVLDLRNKAISLENVTSYDVNKSIQRSLTKACARHGLGLYIYIGEDLPEAVAELEELRENAFNQAKKKSGLSDEAKEKVAATCKEYIESGNPREIEDSDLLRELIKKLKAIRK